MAVEFMMPKLGLTMEAGTIVNWLVDDGDQVESGQPVLVIETDKVESEVEATGTGLFHRVGEVGAEYPCGAHIGWLLEPGEAPPAAVSAGLTDAESAASGSESAASGSESAASGSESAASGGGATAPPAVGAASTSPASPQASSSAAPAGQGGTNGTAVAATGIGGRLLASPNAKRIAAERGVDLWSIAGTGPGGRITSEDVEAAPTPAAAPASAVAPAAGATAAAAGRFGGTVLASTAARQLADLLGIDLAAVAPAGIDPRITKDDVAAHVRALLAGPATYETIEPSPNSTTADALSAALQTPSSVIPLRGMRGTIAKRMSQSLHSMAQLTLTMDVDMAAVVADRGARKAAAGAEGSAPGYTDYVIAAAAAALVEHPAVNSQIIDEGVALLPQVNVGMAVALDDGLIVPVIADTPSLDIEALSAETSRLAAAARDGKLTLTELEGGTFSVTALGMFDVDGFTPIINAPNTAILGVGRLRHEAAWNDDGELIRATRLTLSLTWDHRAFDGAPAAQFVRTIKQNLENLS